MTVVGKTMRLEVKCECGRLGRLTSTGRKAQDGRVVCKFVCSCVSPSVDFSNPYVNT